MGRLRLCFSVILLLWRAVICLVKLALFKVCSRRQVSYLQKNSYNSQFNYFSDFSLFLIGN